MNGYSHQWNTASRQAGTVETNSSGRHIAIGTARLRLTPINSASLKLPHLALTAGLLTLTAGSTNFKTDARGPPDDAKPCPPVATTAYASLVHRPLHAHPEGVATCVHPTSEEIRFV